MYYLISYDLQNSSPEDYPSIDDALQKLGAEKILRTVWAIYRKDTTAESIVRLLNGEIKENRGDGLVVVCFGDDLSNRSFSQKGLGSILYILKKMQEVH